MILTAKDIRICAALTMVFFWVVWELFSGGWDADLSAIYFAAYSYGTEQFDLIYMSEPMFFGSSASLDWEMIAADFGFPGEVVLPYIYAPIWTAVLAPFATAVTPRVFFDGMLMVHAAACAGSIYLAWRIVAPRAMSFTVWSLISFGLIAMTGPFTFGFWLNQPQFIVTFLILLAFERYRAGAMFWAGLALGVAAAIKISPAILVVIFLMGRNWNAALYAVVTGLGLLGLSVLIAGIDLHIAFLDQLQKAAEWMTITPVSYSVEGLAAVSIYDPGAVPVDNIVLKSVGWIGWVGKASILLFAGVLWWVTRHADRDAALLGRLLSIWCALIFFGPLGWSHYLIGPLLLLPGLLSRLSWVSAMAIMVLVSAMLSHPLHRYLMDSDAGDGVFMTLGAASLLVMAMSGFVAARRVDS